MSIISTVTRSSRIAAPTIGVPARWCLILTAIALASVILVQGGVLPWTLGEIDPSLLVP